MEEGSFCQIGKSVVFALDTAQRLFLRLFATLLPECTKVEYFTAFPKPVPAVGGKQCQISLE